LLLQRLDEETPRFIPGSHQTYAPVVSHDQRWLAARNAAGDPRNCYYRRLDFDSWRLENLDP